MGSDNPKVAAAIPNEIRPAGRPAKTAAAWTALILGALIVLAVAVVAWDYLQPGGPTWLIAQIRHRPYFASSALLAAEEAGVPLPLPGDVVVMFAADHSARTVGSLVSVWLLLMSATLLGSGALFALSRRFGRGLAEGRVGEALHLTPERIRKAETWFRRYGLWTVLLGRYVPAGRVPITVAAATFGLPMGRFLFAVAASATLWILVFMTLGVELGPKVDDLIRAHRTSSLVIPTMLAVGFFGYLAMRMLKPCNRFR